MTEDADRKYQRNRHTPWQVTDHGHAKVDQSPSRAPMKHHGAGKDENRDGNKHLLSHCIK